MSRLHTQAWMFLALSTVSLAAQAHTPYLLPNIFHASNRKPVISVDVSLTDNFFIPDLAYGDHPFSVIAPNGAVISIPNICMQRSITRPATSVPYTLHIEASTLMSRPRSAFQAAW